MYIFINVIMTLHIIPPFCLEMAEESRSDPGMFMLPKGT